MWIWDANIHAVPLCLAILPFERLSRSNIVATDLCTRDTQRPLNTNMHMQQRAQTVQKPSRTKRVYTN
jgi:hypothetical protein